MASLPAIPGRNCVKCRPDDVMQRFDNTWDYVIPRGECYAQLSRRVLSWLHEVKQDTVVAAHAGVSRILQAHYSQHPHKNEVAFLQRPARPIFWSSKTIRSAGYNSFPGFKTPFWIKSLLDGSHKIQLDRIFKFLQHFALQSANAVLCRYGAIKRHTQSHAPALRPLPSDPERPACPCPRVARYYNGYCRRSKVPERHWPAALDKLPNGLIGLADKGWN